jgi:hypothetical protein
MLVDKFITGESIDPLLAANGLAPTPTEGSSGASSEPKKTTSFDSIVKLRAQLSSGGTREAVGLGTAAPEVPPSASSQRKPGSDVFSKAIASVYQAAMANKFMRGLADYLHLRQAGLLQSPVAGRGVANAGALPARAFPPMCAATVVYAVQSASMLLVRALGEDTRGTAQRSMPAVLRGLLLLEEAVVGYCATLQASQFVRIASVGRTQEIRYRARSESAVPDEIKSILEATREAILRVAGAYRDELLLLLSNYSTSVTSAMFSKAQLLALESKLMEISKPASE